MSKQTTKTLVPKLRFPEFWDAGAWEVKKLGEIGEFTGGGTPSKNNESYWSGSIPWISSSDISEDSVSKIKISRFISKEALKKSATKLVPENSILLVSRVGVGKLAFSRKLVCTSQDFTNLTPQNEDLIFLAYYLKSLGKKLLEYSQGMAIKGFTKEDVSKLELYIPPFKEQQKIADCLSSLDELIAAHSKKLEALQSWKKGLMQNLFPAEGNDCKDAGGRATQDAKAETVPALRFPEFQDAGEWKFRRLAKFIKERNQFSKGKLPLYSLTIEDGVSPKTERYERSFLVNNEKNAYKLVKLDDFAYNPMNLRFGAIGRHSGSEQVAVSKYYNIFYCDKSVDSRFCEVYFRSPGMIVHYDNVAAGSLIEKRRVHFNEFLKFDIRFPTLEEQQKIADCLSSVDELITAQAQKIEDLKAHKKGLMQQLFPGAEAMGA